MSGKRQRYKEEQAAKKRVKHEQYNAFICSPEWDVIRRAAYERAGRKCEKCGADYHQLHAHHKTYVRFGGKELPEDIEVLCAFCHKALHLMRHAKKVVVPKPIKLRNFRKGLSRKQRRRGVGTGRLDKQLAAQIQKGLAKKGQKQKKKRRFKNRLPGDLVTPTWAMQGSPEYEARQKRINAKMQRDYERRVGKR